MNENFTNGVIAGALARTIIAPLDFLKIRYQINKNYSIKYIIKNEGYLSFWKGNFVGSMYYAIYCGNQFLIYEYLKKNYNLNPLLNGGIAGLGTSLVTYPLDSIKTRLVSQSNTFIYRNIIDIFKKNPKYLFDGLGIHLFSIVPYTSSKFYTYELLNSYNINIISSGAIAGAMAQTITMPMDNIEKRLQINRFSNEKNFKKNINYILFIKNIINKEGIKSLYKGLTPALIKQSITSSLIFSIYNKLTSNNLFV